MSGSRRQERLDEALHNQMISCWNALKQSKLVEKQTHDAQTRERSGGDPFRADCVPLALARGSPTLSARVRHGR